MIKDILQREHFVEQVETIINAMSKRGRGYTFAIDGRWGCGKSFVLEMLEKKISIFETQTESIESTEHNKYFLFHYNCWEYDYYDEPLIAIVAALKDSIEKYQHLVDAKYCEVNDCFNKVVRGIANISNQVIKHKLGINIAEAKAAVIKDKNDFDTYLSLKKTIFNTRTAIQDLSEKKPIIIVVDELDRCLPEYAIKVLERLHHIFYDIEKVIVIMAVDNRQLDNTIKKIFGDETDTDKYLKKFIDFKLYLDQGVHSKEFYEKFDFYFSKFKIKDISEFQNGLSTLFKKIKIREQEKIIRKADLIHSICADKEYSETVCLFELFYLILKSETNSEDGVRWLVQYIWESTPIPDYIKNSEENYGTLVNDICKSNIHNHPDDWDAGKTVKFFNKNLYGLAFCYLTFTEEEYVTKHQYYFNVSQFDPNNKLESDFAKKFATIAKIL